MKSIQIWFKTRKDEVRLGFYTPPQKQSLCFWIGLPYSIPSSAFFTIPEYALRTVPDFRAKLRKPESRPACNELPWSEHCRSLRWFVCAPAGSVSVLAFPVHWQNHAGLCRHKAGNFKTAFRGKNLNPKVEKQTFKRKAQIIWNSWRQAGLMMSHHSTARTHLVLKKKSRSVPMQNSSWADSLSVFGLLISINRSKSASTSFLGFFVWMEKKYTEPEAEVEFRISAKCTHSNTSQMIKITCASAKASFVTEQQRDVYVCV